MSILKLLVAYLCFLGLFHLVLVDGYNDLARNISRSLMGSNRGDIGMRFLPAENSKQAFVIGMENRVHVRNAIALAKKEQRTSIDLPISSFGIDAYVFFLIPLCFLLALSFAFCPRNWKGLLVSIISMLVLHLFFYFKLEITVAHYLIDFKTLAYSGFSEFGKLVVGILFELIEKIGFNLLFVALCFGGTKLLVDAVVGHLLKA